MEPTLTRALFHPMGEGEQTRLFEHSEAHC
jgi:hypothetical protein